MTTPERGDRLRIPLHGSWVEVPAAALRAELDGRGPVSSLALVEAMWRAADRDPACARLVRGLEEAQPGTIALATILALVRLDAAGAGTALDEVARRVGPPLSATALAARLLLEGDYGALAAAIGEDDLVAQRTPFVLNASPRRTTAAAPVRSALCAALVRLQPVLGITAYRAFLGDLAEALYRAVHAGADPDALLGADRGPLFDRLCAELPGTPDLVAARGMAWLLGVLGPNDDAAHAAIERARQRFRDPAFHADCDAIFDGRWPPAPEAD